ncbi:hypothetical protein [uncultured Desulfuromusa sp.]|uniref:hypothetical protein n=1 Tax=uncultured Desulfuromusa sp. TaxID=219183 RepID=UPI002AA649D5|nr:hypothetical protein [uncultured Desulfuromusa sp.]
MKRIILISVLTVALLSGCATVYMGGWSGPTATVVFIQESQEHFFSIPDGNAISDIEEYNGNYFSSRHGLIQSTTVYIYESQDFSDSPAMLGNSNKAPLIRQVKAGVPMNALYRTRYQTSERHSYKFFYTTSVFTPEAGAKYEVIIEPIDGVVVYQLKNGKRTRITDVAKGPSGVRY